MVMGKHLKLMSATSRKRVSDYFDTITNAEIKDQKRYWVQRYPESDKAIRNRWLFAFASVHTSWTNNVSQYEKVKDKPLCNRSKLVALLRDSGGGMHNQKAQGIFHFGSVWRFDQTRFTTKPDNWLKYRNELAKELMQINKAKVSFALEMVWPLEVQSVCLDRHILRLYGQDPDDAPKPAAYDRMERYWVRLAKERNVPPYIARCIYWDRLNNEKNSAYWAKVL